MEPTKHKDIEGMHNTLTKLVKITDGCRMDMHEPDEQELKATVVGDHLDNAFGDNISNEMLREGYHEFVICLTRFQEGKHVKEQFNLATLIALARQAKL